MRLVSSFRKQVALLLYGDSNRRKGLRTQKQIFVHTNMYKQIKENFFYVAKSNRLKKVHFRKY